MFSLTGAIILAGGRSSRMGVDKALLRIGSSTLLEETYKKLLDVVPKNQIWISGRQLPGTQGVLDSEPGLGPLSGIYSTVAQIQISQPHVERVLIVPVDMPLLSVKLFSRLIAFETHVDVVHFEKYELPLVLKINQKTICALESVLKEKKPGLRSIKKLISTLSLKSLLTNAHDEALLINTNTPEEWKENEHKIFGT